MVKRQLKNERNLHKLFATHLPVVPLPADFAEHLVQSVLDEVALQTQNKSVPAEYCLPTAAKPPARRNLRMKRPPQLLLLGLFCVYVSVLFLLGGCGVATSSAAWLAEERAEQPLTNSGHQPPLTPLWPQLPVAVVHTGSAEIGALATAFGVQPPAAVHAADLLTSPVLTNSTVMSNVVMATLISQTAMPNLMEGYMVQIPAPTAAEPGSATNPPPETATSPPPTLPPPTAEIAKTPPVPSPTATPLPATPTPQPNLFLPTATPVPPATPSPPAVLPMPSYTPVLRPLPPTMTTASP